MKLLNIVLVICITACCISCGPDPQQKGSTDNEMAELKKENERLRRELDSIKNSRAAVDTPAKTVAPPPANTTRDTFRGLQGRHDFTLHWISWDEPGSVTIQRASDGWYSIKGGQKSRKNGDYITIDGLIKQISSTDLLFKGEIKSVVETNNNGQPCVKTGEKIFKTTKNRKYWRLQDMINCEGGLLTDYVDIYF
jgi:hypothetical protein